MVFSGVAIIIHKTLVDRICGLALTIIFHNLIIYVGVVKQNCESFPVPPIAILTIARIFFLISFKVDMELANYYHVNIMLRLKYI